MSVRKAASSHAHTGATAACSAEHASHNNKHLLSSSDHSVDGQPINPPEGYYPAWLPEFWPKESSSSSITDVDLSPIVRFLQETARAETSPTSTAAKKSEAVIGGTPSNFEQAEAVNARAPRHSDTLSLRLTDADPELLLARPSTLSTTVDSTPAAPHVSRSSLEHPDSVEPLQDAAFLLLDCKSNGDLALGAVPVQHPKRGQETLAAGQIILLLSHDGFDSINKNGCLEHKEKAFRLVSPYYPTPTPFPCPRTVQNKQSASQQQQLELHHGQRQPYNAERPLPLPQTMESVALHHPQPQSPPRQVISPDLDTPAHVTDHGMPSNLRNADQDPIDQVYYAQQDQNLPLTIDPAYDSLPYHDLHSDSLPPQTPIPDIPSHALDEPFAPQPGPLTAEQPSDSGYAMLSFEDSYHVFKTTNLVITRDERFHKAVMREKKQARKSQKYMDAKYRRKARRDLYDYVKEPSQPSQLGDDGASSVAADDDDGNLEGRPRPSHLSNFSEVGGPVAYDPPSEDDVDQFPRRERLRRKPTSSSANSIAPNDLQAIDPTAISMSALEGEAYTGSQADEGDMHNWAQLPVHPAQPDDIKRISREHLIFSYDTNELRWVVHVVGNNAYVDGELYRRGAQNIPLHNDTEIIISTICMKFRLPPQFEDDSAGSDEDEDEDVDAVEEIDSGSDRRLSNGTNGDGEEDELDEQDQLVQKPTIKLKLKASKASKTPAKTPASGKGKEKPKAAAKSTAKPTAVESPETAAKADNAKKEDDADGKADAVKTEQDASARAATILPGSILENLAPDQMPEKRKGPGRPPKNGFLSKRDERAVQRRKKEYERQGIEPPDFNVMLAEVREEQKQKDAAAKGNKLRPDGTENAVESIEAGEHTGDGVAGSTQPPDAQASQSADPAPSGLPRRTFKSPSPMKPMEAFTEEELKKPQPSYFYLLDEVLQESGPLELQQIYDKFQKRWPYYKYTVTTTGWQSSIRHNLAQFSRFKAVGKVGKGQLWNIDYDAPREETTKKKKTPPPPRQPQAPMGSGQMPPGMQGYQYGPPQAGAPRYGSQPAYNPGQGQYSSPYGNHPGQYGHPPPRPGMQQMNSQAMGPLGQGQYAQQPPPPVQQRPPQPPNPVQRITEDIMKYRQNYLGSCPVNSPEFTSRSDLFIKAVNYFSEMFHGSSGGAPTEHPGEEALKVDPFLSLGTIFDRHNPKKSTTPAATNGDTNGQSAPTASENSASANESIATATTQPPPSQSMPAAPVQAQANGQTMAPNGVHNAQQQPAATNTNSHPSANGTVQPSVTPVNQAEIVPAAPQPSPAAQVPSAPVGQSVNGQAPAPELPTASAPATTPVAQPSNVPAAVPAEKEETPARPTSSSAGVKRSAPDDVDMTDANVEEDVKRIKTE